MVLMLLVLVVVLAVQQLLVLVAVLAVEQLLVLVVVLAVEPVLLVPSCDAWVPPWVLLMLVLSSWLLQFHLCLGSKPLRLVRLALRLLQLLLVLQLLVLQQLLLLLLQVQLLLQLLLLFWLQRPRTLAAAAPLWLWAPAAPSRCCC